MGKIMWAWRIHSNSMYRALGFPKRKLPKGFSLQRKLMVQVGSQFADYAPTYTFEVRVSPGVKPNAPYSHRIAVRCPHCHSWTPFGRLHQHILSKRCQALALQPPETPSLEQRS